MKAAFVAPVFYRGTSFERICTSIKECIETNNFDIEYIVLAELSNNLQPNEFDDDQFFKHQLKLLQQLIANIQDYDRILFLDFFNPGVDILKYYIDNNGIKTKLYSLLHGGTFIEGDLLQEKWIQKYEKAWTSIYDRVYVPSTYAYSVLPEYIAQNATIFPWGLDSVKSALRQSDVKDVDVVFPHRISKDKGLEELVEICELCPGVQFIITSPSGIIPREFQHINQIDNLKIVVCKDNESYYKLIGRAKIVLSCSKQELYGYSVAEAVLSGAIPILPNRQVYPDFYDSSALYDSTVAAAELIKLSLDESVKINSKTVISKHTFKNMLDDFMTSSC